MSHQAPPRKSHGARNAGIAVVVVLIMAIAVAGIVGNYDQHYNHSSVTIPQGFTRNSDGTYCPPGLPYYFQSLDSCKQNADGSGQSSYPYTFTSPSTSNGSVPLGYTPNNDGSFCQPGYPYYDSSIGYCYQQINDGGGSVPAYVPSNSISTSPAYAFNCQTSSDGSDGAGGTYYVYVNLKGATPEGSLQLNGNNNQICFSHWSIGQIGDPSQFPGCGATINGQLVNAPPNLWNVWYWDDYGTTGGVHLIWVYFADGQGPISLRMCSDNYSYIPQTCGYPVNGKIAVNPQTCLFQGGAYPNKVIDWG